MNTLTLTNHAAMRMAQRGIMTKDAELIVLIGTEVDDGYLVLVNDYHEVERAVKAFLQRCRCVVGKRLIIKNGHVVTAYHPSKKNQRHLLRNAQERDLYK